MNAIHTKREKVRKRGGGVRGMSKREKRRKPFCGDSDYAL